MSDNANVAEKLGGDTPAAPEPKTPAATPSVLDGGGDTVDAPPSADPPTWREDWRESLAGADEPFLRHLKRFASPENFAKSYREIEKKAKSGSAIPALAEDATADEIAAFRKQVGVPETPEGYGIAFPKEMETGEAHQAVLTAFQERMHAKAIPPAAAKEAFQFYVEQLAATEEAKNTAVEGLVRQNLEQLREAFPGREWRRTFGVPNDPSRRGVVGEFFDKTFSKEVRAVIGGARTADGVPLADHAAFLKEFAALAYNLADDSATDAGDAAVGGKSIEAEYKELINKGKLSADEHKRAIELAERMHAREQRQGRSRAA